MNFGDVHRREMAAVMAQLVEVVPAEFLNRPDPYGWSPLHILANVPDHHNVRPGMMQTLVAARAEVDPVKGRGQTPLMAAVASANRPAATMLFNLGADIYATNSEDTSVLDYAWNNGKMRGWLKTLGVGAGAGVSGTGRLSVVHFGSILDYGEKPACLLFQERKHCIDAHFIISVYSQTD